MTHERGSLSRRGFLDRSLAALTLAGLPLWYAHEVLADSLEREAEDLKARKRGPNDQIVMAAIGVGGQGTGIMKWAKGKPDVKFVAVCDLDDKHRKKAAELVGTDCHQYKDFRELLTKEDLDAVTIGTVDHWHALTSIAAMKKGCDVYCEKPLSLTIEEGKAMVQAARKYDRVFQTGSQQRSDARYRLACELVQQRPDRQGAHRRGEDRRQPPRRPVSRGNASQGARLGLLERPDRRRPLRQAKVSLRVPVVVRI